MESVKKEKKEKKEKGESMKRNTGVIRLVAIAAVTMLICTMPAMATIKSINANDLASQFTAGDGTLSIINNADIVVENTDSTQNTYLGGNFSMTSSLDTDLSAMGYARALFLGGTMSINSDTDILLTGNVISVELAEVFDGGGLLAGSGSFLVTGGTLQADFLSNLGDIVQITFSVVPATLSDFSEDFTGRSNISLTPVPEPTTIALLGLGVLAVMRKRK